ncbi:hypothetical protein PTKIN_Ptkin02bG0034900 [Pterospermum kingtungense]
MKDRGKAVEVYNNNIDFFQNYSTSSDVLPYCGEHRLSSCSCSEISSNPRASCTAAEVGSVGRVSFKHRNSNVRNKSDSEEVFLFKRSNSSRVEIKKKNGLWRIGRLFRKKRSDKDNDICGKGVNNGGGVDEKSNDLWVVDHHMGVSRSRSLCSFRGGGGFFGSEDGSDLMNYSGARSSISAARSSGFNGGFSEAEPRKSAFDSEIRRDSSFIESDIKAMRKAGGGGFMDVDGGLNGANRRVFSLRESYFSGGDDSGFIDLKFDFRAESKGEFIMPYKAGTGSIENAMVGDHGAFCNGGSCQMTVDERGIKKSRRSFKGWRWIFKAT